MESIRQAVEEVKHLEEKYELPTETIQQLAAETADFKLYVPLVGRFSAGKSALINNILDMGLDVCQENIGVQTAIPAEISYGEEDRACVCRPEPEWMLIEEYMSIQDTLNAGNATTVKVQTRENQALQSIPHIALVDLPGLDSGYELHDRVIESYLKKSMAFLLVFPADEMIVPKSMEPILHDLNTYQLSFAVVVTKGNRIPEGEREERQQGLSESLKKYFPGQSISIFMTERDEGNLGGLMEYLQKLEADSTGLGHRFYAKRLQTECSKLDNYLTGTLKNMALSLSELEEEQDKLRDDKEKLETEVAGELTEFEAQIPELTDAVAKDVQAALSERMDDFVYDLLHDTDVSGALQEVVRSTLNDSYQKRVMSRVRKHVEQIAGMMELGSANYTANMQIDIDKVCGTEISGMSRTAIDVAGLLLGGPLGGIVAHFVAGWINGNRQEKRQAERDRMRQNLSAQVYPAIDREVRDKVTIDLKKMVLDIRQKVEKDVQAQLQSLQKALEDVTARKNQEDTVRAERQGEVRSDLDKLQDIMELLA
jgi:GTP-binding protein EngB required for normal cell division